MPDFLTPTTELEAINSILASVGEDAVTALDGEFVDASTAKLLLDQESRRVQTMGWTFNTELEVTLTPDNTGRISLPQNTLRFVYSDNSIIQRGSRLYDRAKHTYAFTEPVTPVELVVGLVFDELPEALRLYLTLSAGRKFQDRLQSDQVLHQIQVADERAAWASFKDYEAEQGQYNVLRNNRLALRLKANRPNG